MRRKLLMTASSFGHIENFHLPYIQSFHEMGWEIHIACGGEVKQIKFADRLVELPLKKRMFSPANLSAAAKIHKLMKQEHYDLVITHTSLAAFFTRIVLFGIKNRPHTINTVHGYLFDDKTPVIKRFLLEAAELICAPITDKVLVMNSYDFEWAKKHRVAKEVGFIPGMGVDDKKYCIDRSAETSKIDKVTLVYPAEFSKRKNQTMLIRAMAKLPEQVTLILPGNGYLRNACMILAEELGVKDRITFPGYVNDLANLLITSDIAVSSSRSEGLPFNIIEAMLCGKPVIASRVKGNLDLVEDEITGLIYDYDDIDGFTQTVMKLLDHPESAVGMGKAGREKAERYTLEKVYPMVMEAYMH